MAEDEEKGAQKLLPYLIVEMLPKDRAQVLADKMRRRQKEQARGTSISVFTLTSCQCSRISSPLLVFSPFSSLVRLCGEGKRS